MTAAEASSCAAYYEAGMAKSVFKLAQRAITPAELAAAVKAGLVKMPRPVIQGVPRKLYSVKRRKMPPGWQTLGQAGREAVVAMAKSGVTVERIAKASGVSAWTISAILHEHGIWRKKERAQR
jgi:hypothetical protein